MSGESGPFLPAHLLTTHHEANRVRPTHYRDHEMPWKCRSTHTANAHDERREVHPESDPTQGRRPRIRTCKQRRGGLSGEYPSQLHPPRNADRTAGQPPNVKESPGRYELPVVYLFNPPGTPSPKSRGPIVLHIFFANHILLCVPSISSFTYPESTQM